MNRLWQARCWLALLAAGQFFVRPLHAQNSAESRRFNQFNFRSDRRPVIVST